MRDVPRRVLAALCIGGLVVVWGCGRRPLLPTPPIIEGWQYSELPESYDRETLYRYINGKARVYLDYGFVRLDHVQFAEPGVERVIDVDVYDMGSPTGAFGIYSLERGENVPRHYRKRFGYMIDSARFFWKGRHYVTITSPQNSPDTIDAIKSLSLYLEASVPGDTQGVPLLEAFPAEGKVYESEQYFSVNLLGHEFMGGGFLAAYQEKGNRFKLFLSPKESSDAATRVFHQLRESLSRYGEMLGGAGDIGQSGFLAKDSSVGTWFVSVSGRYVVGAVGFHEEEFARKLLSLLCKNLPASAMSAPAAVERPGV